MITKSLITKENLSGHINLKTPTSDLLALFQIAINGFGFLNHQAADQFLNFHAGQDSQFALQVLQQFYPQFYFYDLHQLTTKLPFCTKEELYKSYQILNSEKIVLLNDSELVDFTEEVLPEVKVSLTQAPSPTKEIAKNNDVNNDLSSDFCSSKNTATSSSKKAFVCSVLPSAIRMNKQIYKQRLLVIALEKKSEKEGLSDKEEAWIAKLKTQYGLPMTASYSDLLSRVDVVPIALLITQASMESGWGTSRASKEAKNLFGVHGVHGKDNCIAALQNPNVCIKKYASFDQSIGDYMQFLNTKKSTQNFRNKRKQLRDRNQSLDAVVLASTLTSYSELGVRYTEMIVSMMKKQNFVSLIFNEDDVEAETV